MLPTTKETGFGVVTGMSNQSNLLEKVATQNKHLNVVLKLQNTAMKLVIVLLYENSNHCFLI